MASHAVSTNSGSAADRLLGLEGVLHQLHAGAFARGIAYGGVDDIAISIMQTQGETASSTARPGVGEVEAALAPQPVAPITIDATDRGRDSRYGATNQR